MVFEDSISLAFLACCTSSKGRQRQWYNRMGGIYKPVSERFNLPMKNSKIYHSTNNREKDARMNASSETWQLGNQSVQVTHLEKVYWPQTGFTKGDVLHYYQQIAPVVLPYLKDRPVTLRVYPQGVEGARCSTRRRACCGSPTRGPSNSTCGVPSYQISRSPTWLFLIWIPARQRRSLPCGKRRCGCTRPSNRQESQHTPRPAGETACTSLSR